MTLITRRHVFPMAAALLAGLLGGCTHPGPDLYVKPLADGAWRDTTTFDSRSCSPGRHVVVQNGEGSTFVLMAYPPFGTNTGRFYLADIGPGVTDTLYDLQPGFTVGAQARDASFIARKAGDNGALPPRHLRYTCAIAAKEGSRPAKPLG